MSSLTRRLAGFLGATRGPKHSASGQARSAAQVKVKVIGVGGAGCNAVVRLAEGRASGLDILAVNTDMQALEPFRAWRHSPSARARPAAWDPGGSPEVGRKAVRESHDQLAQLFSGVEMAFVTAGMGGGTGTGAAPAIADMARRQGRADRRRGDDALLLRGQSAQGSSRPGHPRAAPEGGYPDSRG